MRVLLVGPEQEDNLSVRYLSSSLREAGHEAVRARFNSAADTYSVLTEARGFDLIGLSLCFQVRAPEFLRLAELLKRQSNALVIAGGHYATCAADELMAHHSGIDAVVFHEGERTLAALADAGPDRQAWATIPGILYRDGAEVRRTATRRILPDLDLLPFPDRSGPVRLYAGVPTAFMMGSRGCVASCDYCCITTLHRTVPGKRFRRRDPERVADEMAELYHGRGIRQFIFHDDNFLVPSRGANHARLDAYERAWDRRGLHDIGIVLKCRPPDVEEDVFRRLKDMGLLRCFLGIESSSEEGLCSIGRRQTVEASERALGVCRRLGISAQYTMMMFHPDATLATVRSDLDFMRRHGRHALNFCRTEIYAGTPLEHRMLQEGRARGSYLARTYRIADSKVDLACTLALRTLGRRCWSLGGLTERVIGMDHLGAIVERFYDGPRATDFVERARQWRDTANLDLVGLLNDIVDAAEVSRGAGDPRLAERLRAIITREARSRQVLLETADALWRELDEVVLPRIGLHRDGGLRPAPKRRAGAMVSHATAVLLALSGGYACDDCIGVSEFAPPPMPDSDGDGLPDDCEVDVYGTHPLQEDTDFDGTMDGDEDHDMDGATNTAEQSPFGEWGCPPPDTDGGT